ncbi:hypothetical protein TWF481_009108 [Arthrobotrys musiformis]|uniref:Uncharacterized protein n=1 Tax=Arthrobotrys musiformis TaxID=47236 RepID=A0AAV9W4Z3_9PEZI
MSAPAPPDPSRLTPGVHAAKKVTGAPDPKLLQLAHAKSQELRKERLKGSILTRIPVYTSLGGKEPLEVVIQEPAEHPKPKWADIRQSDIAPADGTQRRSQFEKEWRNADRVLRSGQKSKIRQKVREWNYALIQLYIYLVYWFATWVGASIRKPGKWRQLAFRYPPVEGGWDFFDIRAEFESLTRSNVIYTKKKIWFNPETGHYETVMFTNLDDESQYRDRYPGETDGIDPTEFARYHYLSPDDTVVKWLGEKVFTPIMTIFVAFLTFLVLVNGAKISISVAHMLAAEYPDLAVIVVFMLFGWLTVKLWRLVRG